jgi:hypothetical protein
MHNKWMNEKIKDLISRVYKIKNITQYFWNILLFLLLETLYIIRSFMKDHIDNCLTWNHGDHCDSSMKRELKNM